jgi:hypothetical protein
MHKPSFTLAFLALFTTVEKAAEIEGDLLEQARVHGRLWFVTQVIAIAFALFWQTLLQQPLPVLLPAYAVYELVVKLHLWALRPLRYYLEFDLDYSAQLVEVSIKGISFVLAYLIGMTLVRFLPKTGMPVAIGAVTLIMARVLMLQEVMSASAVLFFAMPILLGGLHAKSMNLYKQFKTEHLLPH